MKNDSKATKISANALAAVQRYFQDMVGYLKSYFFKNNLNSRAIECTWKEWWLITINKTWTKC